MPSRCAVASTLIVPAASLGVEAGDAKALAKVADAHGRPGLAVGRLATHPVHGDREIAVRPLATELADDLDRTRVSIRRDSGRS